VTEALLFSVQRFSTEDGPGIRTTLFFKGCPLSCPWCHNPEGLMHKPEIMRLAVDCVGCGDCAKVCNGGALTSNGGAVVFDRGRCRACGACVEACGPGAIEMVGRRWSAGELLDEVLKDRTFYSTSGGGITLSGGEPLVQADFLMAFLPRVRAAGLHTALDTSGAARRERFAGVLPLVDLVLFDIKMLDESEHLKITGEGTQEILANAVEAQGRGVPMWVRTPVIPGYTDADENIREIARFIRKSLPSVQRYDLLAYSNLCRSKYERLGRNFGMGDTGALGRERMEKLAETARREGISRVTWSGPTAD
jgi:pyruvate formate lyase activating enzyme